MIFNFSGVHIFVFEKAGSQTIHKLPEEVASFAKSQPKHLDETPSKYHSGSSIFDRSISKNCFLMASQGLTLYLILVVISILLIISIQTALTRESNKVVITYLECISVQVSQW
jgi:hypothetical protein